MTNADKIRNMNNEELALIISCPADFDIKWDEDYICNDGLNEDCYKCTLAWLKSE